MSTEPVQYQSSCDETYQNEKSYNSGILLVGALAPQTSGIDRTLA